MTTGVLLAPGCREAAVPPHSRAVDSAFTVAGRPVAPATLNDYVARHEGFTSRDGEMRCAYVPLAQRDDRIFLQTLCLEIVPEGDSLIVGSGRGGPVALRLAPAGDSVRIVSHEVPEDGGGYTASVERIFPEDVARRIFAYTGEDTLQRHLEAEAERRLARTCYVAERSVLARAPGSPAPGPANLRGWIALRGAAAARGQAALVDSDGAALGASWSRVPPDSVHLVGFDDFLRVEMRLRLDDGGLRGSATATSDAAAERDARGRMRDFRRQWRVEARAADCDSMPRPARPM